MSDNMTFPEAIEIIRTKLLANLVDDEYLHALDIMAYLWDQEHVNRINKAVLKSNMHPVPEGKLYLLVHPRQGKYVVIHRNKRAYFI